MVSGLNGNGETVTVQDLHNKVGDGTTIRIQSCEDTVEPRPMTPIDLLAIALAELAILAYFLRQGRLFRTLAFVAVVCIVLDRTIF